MNFTEKQYRDIMCHMYRNQLQGYNGGVARDFAELYGCTKDDIISFYQQHKMQYIKDNKIIQCKELNNG